MIDLSTPSKLLLFGESSDRLEFRALLKEDFHTWMKFCEHPDSLKYIRLTDSDSAHEKCNIWFNRVFYRYENNLGGMNALIHKDTKAFVGQCGLLIHTIDGKDELEIGYSLMPEYRGFGFALEAAKKCKEHAFKHHLADSLISIIYVENKASEKIALRNGMHLDKTTTYNRSLVNIYRIENR